ncbi:hypothetical protein V6N11_052507 [Hibiscus sabdariffa]|uniref:Uncharacterized protein n=1 Tax=Hibiscus sabdariffa TaxID=183260 RepID=A0ABR2UAG7_9ROSI
MKLNKQVGEEDFVALETEGNLVGLQRVVSKESLCLENNKAGEKDNGPNKEYGLQLDTEVESGVGPNMIKTGNNSKLESEMKEEPKDKAWEPKRSCANVVDELVNSRMASKWNAQESTYFSTTENLGIIKDASRGQYLERTSSKFGVSLVAGVVLFR